LKLLRAFRIVILSAATVSLGGFGVSEENLLLGAVLVFAACAGWAVTEFWARGVPRWATNLILIGLLIGACVRVLQGGAPVSAFNGFLAALLVLKMWERREVRDYGQVLTMSLFLAIGGTLNRSTLGVGLTLIVLAPLLVAGTMMFQILAPWSKASGAALAADERRNRRSIPSIGPVGVFSGIGGIAIAFVVFVSVPRGIGLSEFGKFGSAGGGRVIGFSDRVQLGQGGLLSESPEIVMTARFLDVDNQPLGGEGAVRYLRGAVLDHYDDGRWSASPRGTRRNRSDEVRERGQTLAIAPIPRMGTLVQQRYRFRGVGAGPTPLFTLLSPRSITLSEASIITLNRRTQTLVRNGELGPLEYTVLSSPDISDETLPVRADPPRALPDPGFRLLADELLAKGGIPADPAVREVSNDGPAARIFEAYLRNNLTYTRSILACPPDRDPTEWFLFDARTGHCEYFASALVALCRSVGINARVVTGYVAGEFDASSFEYTVRSSSAHAWAEVEIGPGQWRTMDGTPSESVPTVSPEAASVWGRLMRSFESVQDAWADSVVSFDSARQSRLFGGSEFESSRTTAWIERLSRGRFTFDMLRSGFPLTVAVAAAIILAFFAAATVVVPRLRARHRAARAAGFGDLTPLYADLLARFRRMGRPKPPHVSALRHARTVANAPGGAGLVAATELLFGARFSGRTLSEGDRATTRAALRSS